MSIDELTAGITSATVARLAKLARLANEPRPAAGWARVIREALGMTRDQLALRLGVRGTSVATLERNEATGAITLESLDRLARGMGCKVVYAIVPADGGTLDEAVRRRAADVATEQIARARRKLGPEEQRMDRKQQKELLEATVATLLEGPRRNLWD
ncbi:MAG TPA: mobile mystery protein A [Usitatibacteraceae bacterium]|nr:mobile mystery protein A [Usitatibacteraceae bacterium]